MASKNSAKINLYQNRSDFQLEPIDQQSPLFKYRLFEKILDPIKGDPEDLDNERTCTIKCLYQGCK